MKYNNNKSYNYFAIIITLFIILCTNDRCIVSENHTYSTTVPSQTIKWQLEIPADKDGIEVVNHTYYTLGYVEEWEQPAWVAYQLTSLMLNNKVKRKDNFREDNAVKTGSAYPGDYSNSGYDKGHLCPAGDMMFSEIAMSETFFMSNMSPQVPEFNRGIWKSLESLIREWAKKEKKLYIVTGPIIKPGYKKIGYINKVAVPQYFYKAVLYYGDKTKKSIGFILPHEGSKQPLSTYAVSIDSVEKMTGLDFFYKLPDEEEEIIENKVKKWEWKWPE